MSYLRWVKDKNELLHCHNDVINLASSGVELVAAKRWLEQELTERASSLVASAKSTTNEFGLPELKERIRAAYQVPTNREVMLTCGATGSIRFAFELLLAGKGARHFVAEQPFYEPLVSVAERMGARVELAPRGASSQFIAEVARRITPETAAVVLTNPHNPTGDMLDVGQLRELVDVVSRGAPQAAIIVDETFSDLSRAVGWSTGNLDDRIVTISGLTKCYGLGSLRCGWMTADRERFPRMVDDWIEFENIGCKWTELLGALALAQIDEWRPQLVDHMAANRRVIGDWSREMADEGLLANDGEGESCVTFPRWLGRTPTMELVERLLREHRVLVAPGEFFRPVAGMGMRIGFGGDGVKLLEGLKRLEGGLRAIG